MGVDFELLRVLRKPQKPRVESCDKDAGCVQAQAVALDAVYKAMEKPRKESNENTKSPRLRKMS